MRCRHDPNPTEALKLSQVPISRDDDLGSRHQSAGQDLVIVRIFGNGDRLLNGQDDSGQGGIADDQIPGINASLLQTATEFPAPQNIFELDQERRRGEQLQGAGPRQVKDPP